MGDASERGDLVTANLRCLLCRFNNASCDLLTDLVSDEH
jgi:hypothetical protein